MRQQKISGHKSARRQRCNKAQNRHRKTCQQPRRAVFVFSPIHRNRKMRPFPPRLKGNTRRMAVQYKEVEFQLDENKKHNLDISGLGLIRAALRQNNTYRIVIQGLARMLIKHPISLRPYPIYEIAPLEEEPFFDSENINILANKLKRQVNEVVNKMSHLPSDINDNSIGVFPKIAQCISTPLEDFLKYVNQIEHPGVLADLIASTMIIPGKDRQIILNEYTINRRLRIINEIFCRTYGLPNSPDEF